MGVTPIACQTRSRLLREYQDASTAHSRAVADLSANTPICAKHLYQKFYALADKAGNEAREAQGKLVDHIKDHHCGVE